MSKPNAAPVVGQAGQTRGSDFAELSREIKLAGLLDRRRGHYLVRIAVNTAVFAAGCAAFVLLGDSWWQLAVAALFGVLFTQLAFVGHDAGHRQIFRTKRANDVTGFAHSLVVGLSYGWWVGKHSKHHANPNHEDHDPDVDIKALSFSLGQSSTKRGFLRMMARYQAFLFFPLLLLEGLSLHASGVRAVVRGDVRQRALEAVLIGVHILGYLAAVFLVMSPVKAVVFIAVHQGLFGLYMGCSFAPNHKGMPMLSAADELDFLRKQVLTSRNVRGGWFVDFLLGGLNYQIEHHLFPSMPRPSLRRAQLLVRDFCAARTISYQESSLVSSYAQVLRHLHAVGAPLR
ncbi:fatty acid desaturase family protein [Solihabitans fulvus]|uniref:fatty acid desaturase family protein n=1 Tax=Solihabitans fulvus TaxID=1892852 RepID=UPI001CB75C85|nr:acyl-CoA desaturase [Solihabitans fulvus]